MPTDDGEALLAEVTDLYVAFMQALEGADATAAQSALVMATLMTGEYIGLEGSDLVRWIEDTGHRTAALARIAEATPPPN